MGLPMKRDNESHNCQLTENVMLFSERDLYFVESSDIPTIQDICLAELVDEEIFLRYLHLPGVSPII